MPGFTHLTGRVALVAGATRGAGRGIAVELGRAGAHVYVTGRSARGAPSPMQRPETIEETAELVAAAGGTATAVRVDHGQPPEVAALVARIEREHGRLDVLVNDIWGGDGLIDWQRRFWEHDLEAGLRALRNAIDTHLITSWHAAPLLLRRPGGLIVEVTDGAGDGYRGNLFYDLAKDGAIRLAAGLAAELAERGATAVAITPGFLRSEAMLDHFGVTEETWRDAIAVDPHFAASETPRFVGRAIARLAADPDVGRFAGQALSSWRLAAEYDFTDLDGSRPDWGAHFAAHVAGAGA
jgi:NAD(P)-dependent dehydrogenase (short-subunit alcohol dehydrogenase family)